MKNTLEDNPTEAILWGDYTILPLPSDRTIDKTVHDILSIGNISIRYLEGLDNKLYVNKTDFENFKKMLASCSSELSSSYQPVNETASPSFIPPSKQSSIDTSDDVDSLGVDDNADCNVF